MGGGTTDLAIFKDGIIRHTAVIPFGGNVITEDIKEGCSIIEKQAELLKVKFGSAWPGENRDSEIVSIPGLRGREPKEISLKTLSKIINARVVEIMEQVYLEIKNYGHDDQKKKLIGGVVRPISISSLESRGPTAHQFRFLKAQAEESPTADGQ